MIGPAGLRRLGLLGMNRRNSRYTLAHNPRRLYPLVDNKLLTKEILQKHGLPSPELYFQIQNYYELRFLGPRIEHLNEFVLKPARGAEGRGIVVVADRNEKGWVKASGEILSRADIEYHVSNILAGLYSLGGTDDVAFAEYRIMCHTRLASLAYRGVPDIRVVLYQGVPVMCMLRLPTRESDGRANLHQGAVGAGIEMRRGVTLAGVHHNRFVDRHPDLGAPIAGMSIPFWDDILKTATQAYEAFGLGYMGVDFVIDQLLGPLILELNARPGLNIQLANRTGLIPRLEAVDRAGKTERSTWAKRLELSRVVAGR